MTDLAKALPIESENERDVRSTLRSAAEGLLAKKLPILADFHFERSVNGGVLAVFIRGEAPVKDTQTIRRAGIALAPAIAEHVERIVETVGSDADRLWWAQCVRRLGHGPVDRGLGLLKEAIQAGKVRNPGGLLTSFFKDIAKEMKVVLN